MARIGGLKFEHQDMSGGVDMYDQALAETLDAIRNSAGYLVITVNNVGDDEDKPLSNSFYSVPDIPGAAPAMLLLATENLKELTKAVISGRSNETRKRHRDPDDGPMGY